MVNLTVIAYRVGHYIGNARPRTLLSVAGAVVAITFLSKILGFASQVLVTALLGASSAADSYYFANSIVLIISSSIFGTVSLVFIPHYINKKETQGPVPADRFASAVLSWVFIFLGILTVGMGLFAAPFVNVIGGFATDVRPTAIMVFAATAPLALLVGMVQLLMALYQAKKRFVSPAFMGVLHSFVFITIVASTWRLLGVYALVVGILSSTLIQGLVLYAGIRSGSSLKPSLSLGRDDTTKLLRLSWPLLTSQLLAVAWVSFTRSLASSLPVGSLAALSYAEGLKSMFIGVMVLPIAHMALPMVSENVSKRGYTGAWQELQGWISAIWYITAPVTVLFWVLGEPLVSVLYLRGAFDIQATRLTASALTFYSLGLFAETAIYFTSRYFLAIKDTRTPLYWGVPMTFIHMGLAYWLHRSLQHDGIALAYSLTMVASMVAAFSVLRFKVGLPLSPVLLRAALKIVASGVLMFIVALLLREAMPGWEQSTFLGRLTAVAVPGAISLSLYLVVTIGLGIVRDIPILARLHPSALLGQFTKPHM